MAKRNRSRSTRYNLRSFSATERQNTMRRMMSYLRSLANRRSSGVVTADDAHTFLAREGVNVGQIRTRLSFINSVFSGEMFEYAGTTRSSRPAARGRSISTYTVA